MIDNQNHKANHSTDIYKAIFNVPNNKEILSSVTSPPRRICLCQNGKPNCDISSHSQLQYLENFPGETFFIEAVLVGQLNGSVPGTVQAWLRQSHLVKYTFGSHENVQKIPTGNCTKLLYTIYTNRSHEVLELGAQHPGDISGFEQLHQFQKYRIYVKIKECPVGFSRTTGNGSFCDCIQPVSYTHLTLPTIYSV